jgi:hypothetical protein
MLMPRARFKSVPFLISPLPLPLHDNLSATYSFIQYHYTANMADHHDDLHAEQTEGFKVGEKKTIDEYQKLGRPACPNNFHPILTPRQTRTTSPCRSGKRLSASARAPTSPTPTTRVNASSSRSASRSKAAPTLSSTCGHPARLRRSKASPSQSRRAPRSA